MGTKNNPGKFDCYENAGPDEEMFVLLARDPFAPLFVSLWLAAKANDGITLTYITQQLRKLMRDESHNKLPLHHPKMLEARRCMSRMLQQQATVAEEKN